MFPSVNPKQSFPTLESEILAYWKENDTFRKSVESRPKDNPYRFYDGPPFITGTPHYGTLLSSFVKDTVGRYWTMRGKRVDRVWGWDCHGLPIEEKVQKKLGLKSSKDIEAAGVKTFIDECYKYTKETSDEWQWYIDHIGRWVDMDQAYRTMDQDYMESVMWVFKRLWDQGLIYEGKRVSLYSWKLSTPISNFEVAMDDTYQDVNDPAITVKFRPETRRATGIVVQNEHDEMLLLQMSDGTWSCPGGKNEAGESFLDCAKRELFEETGIEVDQLDEFYETYTVQDGKIWDEKVYHLRVSNDISVRIEEGKMTGYKFFPIDEIPQDTRDHSVHAARMLREKKEKTPFVAGEVSILAWTTTPWTIPANMALAVGADIEYVLVINNGESFIIAKNRVEEVFKGKWEYEIVREFKWSDLVGLSYVPPFPEYYHGKHGDKNHKVYAADFATDSDGTGIVHIAPEFGDVDFGLAKKEGITVTEALDEEGRYTSEIFDYEGTHYLDLDNPEKGVNKINIERMKANGTLFKLEGITHRVPFCPRSGTPLVQKAQKSWFIDIQSQKEKLLEANKQINWFPEYLKFGRFAKGIESAPDWCISRTRYWGAPMPVWLGEDGEQLVVASREEIFEYNKPYGQLEKREEDGKIKYFFKWGEYDGMEFNLHKPYIDAIKLQSPKSGKELTRVSEVLDVWMDSGSMPYAQMHYPFENKEAMEMSFPADFIAEYVGQVRAWFYVMHVLGVLVNPNNESTPTPSFTNVITTGIVNGSDGRKMSKSYGNYPDPRGTIEKHGSDGIRFYMLNSPLLSGGNMDFKEEGIVESIKRVILPLWNTYSFFTTYANIDSWQPSGTRVHFVRHGQTNTNIEGRLSDGLDNAPLNETGRAQAKATGERLRQDGQEFDIIISSTLDRAMQTAEIIAAEIGHVERIVLDEDLVERRSPKFSGKFHTDIVREHFEQTGETVEVHHSAQVWTQDNTDESEEQFCERIAVWYDRVLAQYPGKRILVVSHGGVYRALNTYANGFDRVEAFTQIKNLANAEVAEVPAYIRSNPLDRFIIGELQSLIARTTDALEGYDLQRAARSIVDFMDDLTNWYVRRSRRRFWESGLTADKVAAYETLHRVLVDLTRILAPFCPFVSEYVYRSLTGGESVHLDRYPTFERTWVSPSLLSSMKKAKDLVTLGLALRGREKIRVRQPLARVVIGEQFDPYYLEIIREELNIKEVEIADMSSIARKICKPNARLIGAKFGKSVQDIIREAKAGNFTELDGGCIQVGEYVLEAGEFEVAYEPLDVSGLQVEGGSGTVIAIDTIITDELRIEGYARDIVRSIQDARKEAGYEVTDRIRLAITGTDADRILSVWWDHIASETLATLDPSLESGDIERTVDTEGVEVKIVIKRQ